MLTCAISAASTHAIICRRSLQTTTNRKTSTSICGTRLINDMPYKSAMVHTLRRRSVALWTGSDRRLQSIWTVSPLVLLSQQESSRHRWWALTCRDPGRIAYAHYVRYRAWKVASQGQNSGSRVSSSEGQGWWRA